MESLQRNDAEAAIGTRNNGHVLAPGQIHPLKGEQFHKLLLVVISSPHYKPKAEPVGIMQPNINPDVPYVQKSFETIKTEAPSMSRWSP